MKICAWHKCRKPFDPAGSRNICCSDQCTLECKREQSRRWMAEHKDEIKRRARERKRQRQMSERYRPKSTTRGGVNQIGREYIPRRAYHQGDILHAPSERALRLIQRILKGEVVYVG